MYRINLVFNFLRKQLWKKYLNLPQKRLKVLLIDNFDSFTFNLVHYLESFGCEVDVVRNDELNNVHWNNYDKLVVSPGPGLPHEAGELLSFLKLALKNIPILGVCLGHQALCLLYGGDLINLKTVKHGVQVACCRNSNASVLFKGIPTAFKVGLYHSWAVLPNFSEDFITTLISEEGVVMANESINDMIFSVQFHPESILTEHGKKIIENFIKFN